MDYAKQEIAKVGPWIAMGCTVGGAVLALFAGAVHGWRKELPPVVSNDDLEAQNSNYQRLAAS